MSFSFAAWEKYCADKVKRTRNKRETKNSMLIGQREKSTIDIVSCNL